MENIRATNYFTAFSKKKKNYFTIFLQIVDMINIYIYIFFEGVINNYWEVKN